MRMKFLSAIVFVLLLGISVANSEQTVGLFENSEDSFKGYTLFAPLSSTTTYLIDNQGLLVNSWESEYSPRYSVYLDSNGYLCRSISERSELSNGIKLEKMDWDGNIVWSCHLLVYGHAHHDIEVLPNGNILVVAGERMSYVQSVEEGRDTNQVDSLAGVWTDHIVEISPTGTSSGKAVWDWNAWDRVIQDRNPELENYGVIGDHPELVDINYISDSKTEWTHLNSVDYNEQFDQILISPRQFSEIWIIDHSTSTIQSRGHSEGIRGKGGDLLYRWGNPQAYDQGDLSDQKLFYQHDAQWIPSGCPGEGNILVFNNGVDRGYSSVDEIVPSVDEEGNYYMEGSRFGPEQPVWSWTAPEPSDFNAYFISGAQRLPNGNTLICNGPAGEFFEVTEDGDVVWRYINPVNGEGPVYQGDSIFGNSVFKVARYAPDFAGFDGKDMTPGDPIEKYHTMVAETQTGEDIELELSRHLITRSADIFYQLSSPGYTNISVYNISGQVVKTLVDDVKSSGDHRLTWDGTDNQGHSVTPGVYFCYLKWEGSSQKSRIILLK